MHSYVDIKVIILQDNDVRRYFDLGFARGGTKSILPWLEDFFVRND
jgi:hypothetical protein